jgi:hypothetical protein
MVETAGLSPEVKVHTTRANQSFAFFSFLEEDVFFVVSVVLFVSLGVVSLFFAGVSFFPPPEFPFDA